jgi:transposase
MRRFKEPTASRNQLILMPQSLDEMVAEDEPVRLLSYVMDRLDYGELERSYPGGGCPAYPPKLLVKILVFAYSQGMRSSRKIAQATRVDLRYVWLCEGMKPDFRTLARFRQQKGKFLESLFRQSVRLCQEVKLVLLDYVAIDGTKIESSSGRNALWTRKRIDKEREVIRKILEEAEEADASEDDEFGDNDGTTLPKKLTDVNERKKLVDEAEKRLEESGKKAVSMTDPDARQMKTGNGVRMSYNVQAAVDKDSQVVVGMKVVQDEHDRHQIDGMLNEVYENTGCKAGMIAADTGYYSAESLKALDENSQAGAIAMAKGSPTTTSTGYGRESFKYDSERDVYICPEERLLTFRRVIKHGKTNYKRYECSGCRNCSRKEDCGAVSRAKRLEISEVEHLRQKMEAFLATETGKQQMALRKQVVEPVFGQAKANRGFRRFSITGLAGAWAEASIVFLAHNLFKMVGRLPVPAG